jgi:hypothetical protein
MNITKQLKELVFDIKNKQVKIYSVPSTLITFIAFANAKSTEFTIINFVFLMNPILTGCLNYAPNLISI